MIQNYGEVMESSPWMLLDRNLRAKEIVGAKMRFDLENCGTLLPEEPRDKQIFTLVDSLTVPTYIWTFRHNKVSVTHKWEFIGGLGITMFGIDSDESLDKLTSTNFKNVFEEVVFYKSGSTFSLPHPGEYEFTGGAIIGSDRKDVQVSTQIVYMYKNQVKLGIAWPLALEPGFNHVPLPLKRINGLHAGKVALGIGSTDPYETEVRWSTCVIRPVRISSSERRMQ